MKDRTIIERFDDMKCKYQSFELGIKIDDYEYNRSIDSICGYGKNFDEAYENLSIEINKYADMVNNIRNNINNKNIDIVDKH